MRLGISNPCILISGYAECTDTEEKGRSMRVAAFRNLERRSNRRDATNAEKKHRFAPLRLSRLYGSIGAASSPAAPLRSIDLGQRFCLRVSDFPTAHA